MEHISEARRVALEKTAMLREIAAATARPTADLGEDGDDLIVRLRAHADNFDAEGLEGFAAQCGEAADRLILYREALDDVFGTLHYIVETTDSVLIRAAAIEARDKIDAVLSRSGG